VVNKSIPLLTTRRQLTHHSSQIIRERHVALGALEATFGVDYLVVEANALDILG